MQNDIMEFTTPAQSFKFLGELMVFHQCADRLNGELHGLLDELEESLTLEAWERFLDEFTVVLAELEDRILQVKVGLPQHAQVFPSELTISVFDQAGQHKEEFKRIAARYFELKMTFSSELKP
jgi:hypothetical protein